MDFLSALMQHPRFREGAITTGFIAEEYPDGFSGAATAEGLEAKLAGLAAIAASHDAARAATISGRLDGEIAASPDWIVSIDGMPHAVAIEGGTVTVDGVAMAIDAERAVIDLVIIVSYQSWVDAIGRRHRDKARVGSDRPAQTGCEAVCIDIQPHGTRQASGRPEILNVGGFSPTRCSTRSRSSACRWLKQALRTALGMN